MTTKESKQQINELIEAWELNEAELNQTDIDAIRYLLEENQELKSQLKGTTHCFDEEEHRELKKQLHEASLTIQEMVEQDIECPSNCEKLRKIKKQLEEYIKSNMKLKDELSNKRKEYQDTYKDVRIEIKEYKTQQKEFIKYLEDEIKSIENKVFNLPVASNERNYLVNIGNNLIEILQRYKEIVGNNKKDYFDKLTKESD